MSDLRTEIEQAINRCSAENASNTPDFILAEYLTGCLEVYNKAIRMREDWYGQSMSPGKRQMTLELEATKGDEE
jgi:hypothetical protein